MNIKNNAMSMILEARDKKELERIKLQFLGRSGALTQAMKEVTKLPKDRRPEFGRLANEVKTVIENTIEQTESQLTNKKITERAKHIDITEPGIRPPLGHLHLITQAIREITDIFQRIGFSRVRYPEIEWDHYAFTALNFPDNHPARDDWETFFIDQEPDKKMGPVVLTPHTSNGQVREMLMHTENSKSETRNSKQIQNSNVKNQKNFGNSNLKDSKFVSDFGFHASDLNIKMLNIAKCYRRQSDVSHTQMFHQFEGLVVGDDISITHLKGTLDYFVKSYFGPKRVSRIRPYHFQFTEPSFEVDVSCGVCDGKGCRLCKAGWLEMGGAGMVHPNVMKYGGIDPKRHTGFAFGWGVERVLMMKEGIEIDDLRLLYSNNLEFLEQF